MNLRTCTSKMLSFWSFLVLALLPLWIQKFFNFRFRGVGRITTCVIVQYSIFDLFSKAIFPLKAGFFDCCYLITRKGFCRECFFPTRAGIENMHKSAFKSFFHIYYWIIIIVYFFWKRNKVWVKMKNKIPRALLFTSVNYFCILKQKYNEKRRLSIVKLRVQCNSLFNHLVKK